MILDTLINADKDDASGSGGADAHAWDAERNPW